jgi:uncharacterized protein (TIGR02118 family)
MSAQLRVLCNTPTDPAAFKAYYNDHHLPLAVPGLRAATRSAGPIAGPGGPSEHHLVFTGTFDSMTDLQQGLSSPEGTAAAADMVNFATGGAGLLTFEEQPV